MGYRLRHWDERGASAYGKPWMKPKPRPGVSDFDCMSRGAEPWGPAKVEFCCQLKGVGCPTDMQPAPGVGKLTSALQGCSTKCLLKGVDATCQDRIAFSSQHRFQADPNKCSAAYMQVTQ